MRRKVFDLLLKDLVHLEVTFAVELKRSNVECHVLVGVIGCQERT